MTELKIVPVGDDTKVFFQGSNVNFHVLEEIVNVIAEMASRGGAFGDEFVIQEAIIKGSYPKRTRGCNA